MTTLRPRAIDTLQNLLSSFKQFEKKLDKLQENVNYHGQTLSELHILVANMSGRNILGNINDKPEDLKRLANKVTTMHHDSNFYHEKPVKTKRRNTIQPLSKLTTKSSQGQRNRANAVRDGPHLTKVPTSPRIGLNGKRIPRQRKSEVPRKIVRPRKEDKKQNLYPQY